MNTFHETRDMTDKLYICNHDLMCLYDIRSEIRSTANLEEMFKAITERLINGLQLSEDASVSIWFDGVEYTSKHIPREGVVETIPFDITVAGIKRGSINICFQKETKFSPEGERLVRELSLKLADFIERHELAKELDQYAKGLKELIEEKTRELERSKKRYEDFFQDAPVPMLISRLNGDVVKGNRAFYRLLDYPEDGSVHLNFVSDGLYKNPEIRPFILEKLKEDGFVEGLELTLIDHTGNSIPVLASYTIIDVDGEQCLESVFKDIRIRKELERKLIEQKENLEENVRQRTIDLENQKDLLIKKNKELVTLTEKLRESNMKLQTLFQAITDTVVVIDSNFNILMSNQKDIGHKGKCYKKVFNQETVCKNCLTGKVFLDKTPVTFERVVDNEYYLVRSFPIFDSHYRVICALEFSRAITKEKNLERQLLQADKLASLGQLVSGIAHEINNPNTFILGNLTIIKEAMNDILPILDCLYQSSPELKIARLPYEKFREFIPVLVDDMVQGANRIKGIVDGLRKFAKQDEGFLNEKVNVNAITEACIRLVDNQVRRAADVRVELDPDIPEITGNAQKLQQVIINILINAYQAIEKPRGTIVVSSSRQNSNEILLKISDNGKGMDEKTIKQMFDPFFTTKRHQGGTGLGLSIAYGIIKEHKGRIEVESKVGAGTTFFIYLPINSEET